MTKTKSTKRALLLSALALLMCVSMLIGSTFAWFTDSVTSGNNKIVAGNLDIELEYYNGSAWKTVNKATDLFTGKLWEPGHTEVVYLKLSNLGSLALKYQLGVNIVSETEGITVDENGNDKPFKLSDYIYMGVVEDKQPSFANREEAEAAVAGKSGIISTGYIKSGNMTADADDLYLAVVVYMPETVGNEANYKTGTKAPEINLGINLVATQLDFEEDSFGPDYDEGLNPVISYVSSYEDLKKALKKGGTVELLSDITIPVGEMDTASASVPVAIAITGGKNVVLDLNGNTITTEAESGNVATLFVHDSTLTITGEGEINQNADGFIVWAKGNSTVKVEGGTFNGGADETSVFYASSNVAYDPASGYATINVYGGNFDSDSKDNPADRLNIANVMNHGAGRINYYGGTFGWNPTELVSADDKNYVTVANGYKVVETSGKYVVVPDNVDNVILTADDLAALSGARINGIYMLADDIDMGGANFNAIIVNRNSSATFNGNGYTISNVNIVSGADDNTTGQASMFYAYPSSTLTISDLVLENVVVNADANATGYAAAVIGYCEGAAILNNVDVVEATVNGVKSSGMLVGHLSGSLTATDCDVSGTVTLVENTVEANGHYAGKYLGTMAGATVLNNCTADVTVSGQLNAANIGDVYGRKASGSLLVDGAQYVTTADELRDLAANATGDVAILLGSNITLGDDTTQKSMGAYFPNATSVTIDGNGNTLTLKGQMPGSDWAAQYYAGIIAPNATVTVKDLTIVNEKLGNNGTNISADREAVYTMVRGTSVFFENVDFVGGVQVVNNTKFVDCTFEENVLVANDAGYATNGKFCVFIDFEYNADGVCTVDFEGCTFDASGYGCVKVAGDKGANITVNVEDCSFTNTCPSNSWSQDVPKYDVKMTGDNITVNDLGGNNWSDGANAGFGNG